MTDTDPQSREQSPTPEQTGSQGDGSGRQGTTTPATSPAEPATGGEGAAGAGGADGFGTGT